jgi:hypothetical protein
VERFVEVQQAFYTSQFSVQWVHLPAATQVVQYLENLNIGESLPHLILLDQGLSSNQVKQEFLLLQQHNPYKNIPLVVYSTSMDIRTQAFFHHWNVKVWGKQDPVDIRELLPAAPEENKK